MILIRFTGGLGNQMFQMALGYHLSKKNNTILKYDDSIIADKNRPHELVTHRIFVLKDVFDLVINKASEKEIIYFNGKPIKKNLIDKIWNAFLWRLRKKNLIIEEERTFNADVLNTTDNKCIVGSWQSEMYFKDIKEDIKALFQFKHKILEQSNELQFNIKNSDSICVHVRRGDYVTSNLYSTLIGALSVDYYKNAINYCNLKINTPSFFIFSDDINWCKENLVLHQKHYFVTDEHVGVNASNYLQLMSMCKHFIISNSTFSWWAAWLGEKKESIVVGPKQWYKDKTINSKDIMPLRWIKI